MTYLYHAARARQEELLRNARQDPCEDGALVKQAKSFRKSTDILNLRLAPNRLRKSTGDAPTTA